MKISDAEKQQLADVADQINEIMPDIKAVVDPIMRMLYTNNGIKGLMTQVGANAIAAAIYQGLGVSALSVDSETVADKAYATAKAIAQRI